MRHGYLISGHTRAGTWFSFTSLTASDASAVFWELAKASDDAKWKALKPRPGPQAPEEQGERERLGMVFVSERPLSDLVIEDRGPQE